MSVLACRDGNPDTECGSLPLFKNKVLMLGIILVLAISCIVLFGVSDSSFADDNGSCGENLTYQYNSTSHTLTISGTGEMTGYQPYSPAPWNSYKGEITTVNITEGATSIGSYAFNGCTSLTTVTISDTVTKISGGSFNSCIKLTQVTIPNGVTVIYSDTFSGCRNLYSVTLGSSVETIYSQAFRGCYSLVEVFNLSALPLERGSADYGGIAQYAVILSNTVGESTVRSQGDFGYAIIGEDIFLLGYLGSGTSVVFPDDIGGEDYMINANAFRSSSITAVTFGSGVVGIGDFAFRESKLTEVSIPGTVKSIGNSSFQQCNQLTSVTIGDGVQIIGEKAFSSCTNKDFTSIAFPASVTSIGDQVVYSCSNLQSISVDPSNTHYSSDSGVLFDKNKTTLMQYPKAKAGSTYVIPNTVEAILYGAFYGTSLTSVSIPDSVTTIGDMAFYNCAGLVSIELGSGVESIGERAFSSCGVLESVSVNANNTHYCSDDDVLFDKGKTMLIVYPAKKTDESYIVPNTVVTISPYAFYQNTAITAVTLSDSVLVIGEWAFRGCTNLVQVTNGTKVTTIGACAFYNDSNLEAISLQSARSIGDNAFYKCSKLGSEDLSSVEVIGGYAFQYCDVIQTVDLHSIKTVGVYAFGNCSSLESVTLGNELTEIDQNVFYNCSKVTSITIPENVGLINYSAFQGCSALSEVYIGDGVKTIRGNAFWYCNIEKIYIGAGLTSLDDSSTGAFRDVTFYDTDGTTVLQRTPENLRGCLFVKENSKLTKVAVDIDTTGTTSTKVVDTDSASISQNDVEFLKNKVASNPDITLQVTLKDGTIASFDGKAIASLGNGASVLKVSSVDKSTLSDADKKVVGDNPVFEISFGENTNFGDGTATFTVPYALPDGKSASDLKVFCIKDGAVAETLSCTYADGKVTFGTNHLSMYSIGFEGSGDDSGSDGKFPVWIVIVIVVVAVAAIGGGAFFFMKKKKA